MNYAVRNVTSLLLTFDYRCDLSIAMTEIEELKEKVKLLKEWMELKEKLDSFKPDNPPIQPYSYYVPYPIYPPQPQYPPPLWTAAVYSSAVSNVA